MLSADDVRGMGKERWRALLRDGYSIDPAELEGWAYRGTSLGLPSLIERLTWTTFQKAFHRDPSTGALRGWNVRLVQKGLAAKSEPIRDHGVPRTFGKYEVTSARDRGVPHGFDRGLLIDYGRGGNAALDPTSRMRDPIVAINEGDATLLLGWSYLWIAGRAIDTPSFFVLEREHPIDHVPA